MVVEDVETLARKAAAGDKSALDDLLRAIEPDVMYRCGRILPYEQDAEEACQDTLLKVAKHIGTFQGRSKFTTWLYTVAGNCARQTYRSLKRRAVEQAGELPSEAPDPRRVSVQAGARVDILDALDRLDDHHGQLSETIVLRDLLQLEYSQIAEYQNLPIGTVKSRIHEARSYLRQQLGADSAG